MIAFWKKEWLSLLRTGKVTVLGLVFVLFGIMNPAIAKMTPWLLETMGDSLASSGLVVTQVTITALDSWVQFFKNIPMALIVFVVMLGGIFTAEYQSGTLILSLTRGLRRAKILAAKALVLLLLWSVGYWLCFGITYLYNDFFWDNTVARHLLPAVLFWWILGLWTVGLMVLYSAICNSAGGVMLLTGGSFLLAYLGSLVPKLGPWMPTRLMDANALIYGLDTPDGYWKAAAVTLALTVLCLVCAVPIWNKKQL